MDLPNLLSKLKAKEELTHRFVAVEISPKAVKTAVWQVHRSDTQIVSIGSLQPWETGTDDDLLEAIDTSLNDAFNGLEEEPNEVIFGLPETWVNQTGIAPKHKDTVRLICDRLSLKPVGFVVTTEALVRYLADASGSPPSLILLNLSDTEITVALVTLGKIQGLEAVKRSQSIVADVTEGLARFPHTDNLPSRMLLYDSLEDLDSLKQELISYDWLAHLPFLHFPKIESLSNDVTIKAVALSGGAEVAKSLGLALEAVETKPTEPSTLPKTPSSPALSQPEVEAVVDLPDLADTFGFTPTPTPAKAPPPPPAAPPPEAEAPLPPAVPLVHRFRLPLFGTITAGLGHVGSQVIALGERLLGRGSATPRRRLIIIAGLLLLLVAGVFIYYFLPRAAITITVEPRLETQDLTFILDPNATQADPTTNILPSQPDTISLEGSDQLSTTGSVTVGEKAQGKVAIYNRTLSTKTFPQGTLLKTDNLSFVTAADVQVASASSQENADFSITLAPAKVEVMAVASTIGSDANLAANTKLSVANLAADSVVASVVEAFGGGSSQQVAAVSQADSDNLTQTLTAKLTQELATDLNLKDTRETKAVPVGPPETTQADYSAEVGAAADQLQLDLSLSQPIYTFQLADLLLLAQATAPAAPSGYVLIPDLTTVTVNQADIDDQGIASVEATLGYKYQPVLDSSRVIAAIKGKHPSQAQAEFRSLPGFLRAESTIKPNLPFGLSAYPIPAANFSLTVTTQTQ